MSTESGSSSCAAARREDENVPTILNKSKLNFPGNKVELFDISKGDLQINETLKRKIEQNSFPTDDDDHDDVDETNFKYKQGTSPVPSSFPTSYGPNIGSDKIPTKSKSPSEATPTNVIQGKATFIDFERCAAPAHTDDEQFRKEPKRPKSKQYHSDGSDRDTPERAHPTFTPRINLDEHRSSRSPRKGRVRGPITDSRLFTDQERDKAVRIALDQQTKAHNAHLAHTIDSLNAEYDKKFKSIEAENELRVRSLAEQTYANSQRADAIREEELKAQLRAVEDRARFEIRMSEENQQIKNEHLRAEVHLGLREERARDEVNSATAEARIRESAANELSAARKAEAVGQAASLGHKADAEYHQTIAKEQRELLDTLESRLKKFEDNAQRTFHEEREAFARIQQESKAVNSLELKYRDEFLQSELSASAAQASAPADAQTRNP